MVTRQVVSQNKLLSGLERQEGQRVLEKLVKSRLLTVRKGMDEVNQIELVHESLCSHWNTLKQWIECAYEELLFLNDMGQTAENWEKRGRNKDELWRGDALREARVQLENCTRPVPQKIKQFIK